MYEIITYTDNNLLFAEAFLCWNGLRFTLQTDCGDDCVILHAENKKQHQI